LESPAIGIEVMRRRLGAPGVFGYLLAPLLVAIALAIYFAEAKNLGARGTWFIIGEASGSPRRSRGDHDPRASRSSSGCSATSRASTWATRLSGRRCSPSSASNPCST
jgi:hypothetical protein